VFFDKALLLRCQSGDPKSQRAFYDFFKTKVFGLCRRYTRSKEEAEDVFQETFIRIFKNIMHVRNNEHLEQWIRKIAVNTAVTYYHKNKRHHQHVQYQGSDHSNDHHELILSHFSDEQLIDLINNLPDGYRIVFNLHEIEGYSHAEISELLHISQVTSRSQLNRAKQTLKNKLKAYGVLRYEKCG
jgi:RNA polymerase sigma-70 factor (ECF subfamily)